MEAQEVSLVLYLASDFDSKWSRGQSSAAPSCLLMREARL